MLLLLPHLLLVIIAVAADDDNTPSDSKFFSVSEGLGVEYFDNGDTRFGIFMQKVVWQEAMHLCQSRGGSLAEYLKEEDHKFIGRALAESTVGFASLWIGGAFIPARSSKKKGKWKWIQSGVTIDSKLQNVKKFPMTTPPYWVDRPDNKATNHICLATDRNSHDHTFIVAEPCDRQRPYICKMRSFATVYASQPQNLAINVGKKDFHFFTTEETWAKALGQCRMYGMNLAKVETAAEFRILKNRMLRARPVMETAWIGGMFEGGRWVWAGHDEPINVDKNSIISDKSSRWNQPDHIIKEGCLLADRHLCDHVVFVEARCDRRRFYICERGSSSLNTEVFRRHQPPLEEPLIPVRGSDVYISYGKEDWLTAQEMCRSCLGGDLLQLETTKERVALQIPMLYAAMALTLETEIRHVWLGGYLFVDTFKWTNSPDNNPRSHFKELTDKIYDGLQANGENGRLIFMEEKGRMEPYQKQYKCLNLDRDNQKYFSMYGLKCHTKQHFLCKASPNKSLDPSCSYSDTTTNTTQVTSKPTPEDNKRSAERKYRMFFVHEDPPLTWTQTQDFCQRCMKGEIGSVIGTKQERKRKLQIMTDSVAVLTEDFTVGWHFGMYNGEVENATTPAPGSGEEKFCITIEVEHLAVKDMEFKEAKCGSTDRYICIPPKPSFSDSTCKEEGAEPMKRKLSLSSKAVQKARAPKQWVGVQGYPGYYLSSVTENWEDSNDACSACLGGDLLQITASDHGQAEQLRIIREVMRSSRMIKKWKCIWMGSFNLSQDSKWVRNINSTTYEGDMTLSRVEACNGSRNSLSQRCPTLCQTSERLHCSAVGCGSKRHGICITEKNASPELNPVYCELVLASLRKERLIDKRKKNENSEMK